jgi:Amt family ammonium transporter
LGWFGLNAGSGLAANGTAALAFANTLLAPAAALVVWTLLDLRRTGKATSVGSATGIVIGLVAITPAAGFVSPRAGMVIGAVAVVPSYYAMLWRARTSLDDALDVTAAHGLGGVSGALLTGVFAQAAWGGSNGLLAGNPKQLGIQALAVLVSLGYSMAATYGLLRLVGLVAPLRISEREQGIGLDVVLHGEEAYGSGEGAVLLLERQPPRGAEAVTEPGLAAPSPVLPVGRSTKA